MESNNTVPRTLADDLLVVSHGNNHHNDIIHATNLTHEYLTTMGARVATSKSILFTNCSNSRTKLKTHIWHLFNTTIVVATSFRDLGAHINLSNYTTSPTLNNRLHKGTACVRLIARLPIPHKDKAHQIRTRATPAAIHGAETSLLGENLQQQYNSAIKDAVSNHTTHKDSDATFATSSYGPDLGVETSVYINRILLVRRTSAKRRDLALLAKSNLEDYIRNSYVGTDAQAVHDGNTTPAPPHGNGNRSEWRPFTNLTVRLGYCYAAHMKKQPL